MQKNQYRTLQNKAKITRTSPKYHPRHAIPPLPSQPFLILTKQPKNEKLRNLKNVCVNLPSHVPILLTNTGEKSWSFFTLGLQAPRKCATDGKLIHLSNFLIKKCIIMFNPNPLTNVLIESMCIN